MTSSLHVDIEATTDPDLKARLAALVDAAASVDGHEPLGEHKFLRLQHGDDRARIIAMYDATNLVGYAHSISYGDGRARRTTSELVVAPSFRRRGVGGMLLSHCIADAEAQGAARIDVWSYNAGYAGAALAAQFGFTPERRLLHLHRHMVSAPPPPTFEDSSLRAFRPGEDDAAWLALNAKIFAHHPDQGLWTADDLALRLRQPWFDAQDFLVLEREGRLVAFNWIKLDARTPEGKIGEIYVIGVDPSLQGAGLGRRMLAAGLRHLDARGVDVAAIYVDEANAPAVALYRAMGFHHHHVDISYTRALATDQTVGNVAAA